MTISRIDSWSARFAQPACAPRWPPPRSPAPLAGAGSLDGGVQRQQVGLLGDVVDQLEDLPDLLASLTQRQRAVRDGLDLLLHVVHRGPGLLGGAGAPVGAFGYGGRCRGQLVDCGRHLGDRRGLLAGGGGGLGGCRPHFRGGPVEHGRRSLDPPQEAGYQANRVEHERHGGQQRQETGDDGDCPGLAGRRLGLGLEPVSLPALSPCVAVQNLLELVYPGFETIACE